MKRINPKTQKPFKRGDVREDGRLFSHYQKTMVKSDGFFKENWLKPVSFSKLKTDIVAWQQNNQEYNSEYCKNWYKENIDKVNSNTAKRRAAKLQRTPSWLTKEHQHQIDGFYLLAKEMEKQLGGKYEVDHIEPLQGDDVSGLHVPWNLQVLSEADNIRKSNKRVEKL